MTDSSRLVMNQGPQPGQTFILDQDLLTLGRDPGNDIVISDPQVSRQHTRIMRQGDLTVIEDMGSTNGTFVNGMRLTGPHTLVNGDVIGLGDAMTLIYYGVDTAATEALAAPSLHPPQWGGKRGETTPPSYEPSPPTFEPTPPPPYTAAPPPPPAYAASPQPAAPPVGEKKSKTKLWIGCGCVGLLLLACIAVGLLVWYAPVSFWQVLIDLGIPVPTWPF